MTGDDPTHPDTIDWTAFWADAGDKEQESANAAAHHAADLVPEFVAQRHSPDAIADVGCGGGALTFALASAFPDAEVVGFDAAESVLAENRERAASEGVANVAFERGVLPGFGPDRQFDVVACCHTLEYVADSEAALQSLYDAVAPGGDLVLTYTNDLGRAHYGRVLEDPPEEVNPERYEERFGLVVDGESTLSYRAIEDALGTWPRSFWDVVEKPEERWMWRNHPLVWVPKS
jgi:2-polyprenyl-3-methyl-5-hydroxy-6-metoxy-1,4-benzoquinol methylase